MSHTLFAFRTINSNLFRKKKSCLKARLGFWRHIPVVDLDGNPAIWQHSIVEMLACAWLLSLNSESQLNVYLIQAF